MAEDTGSDNRDDEPDGKVVSLFGEKTYKKEAEKSEKTDAFEAEMNAAFIEAADTIKLKTEAKEIDGVLIVMFSTNPDIKAETMIAGPGIFKDIPGAIGMLELLKMDFAEMQARDDGTFD
jgi:hypothetical protein